MYYDKINWCINQHTKTNHYYDTYLPYEFHLRMVANVANDFRHLVDNSTDLRTGASIVAPGVQISLQAACMLAVWGHDVIEDCRCSYNDVKDVLGEEAADIVYAVTNEKGRNRKERANTKYYEGIRSTPGAVFVKLCDRIANVQYSKLTKSKMFNMYQKEQLDFERMLGRFTDNKDLEAMFKYLEGLFNE